MREFMMIRGGIKRPESRQPKLVAFVVTWLITAAAVWVAAEMVGGIHLEGWRSTLLVALILGLLNAYVKPLLVLLGLPALVMTLGLFLLIINTAVLGLTAWIAGKFDSIHFDIDGFWAAFWGALIISIVSWLLNMVVNPGKIARRLT
jgi:putative membrane protein